MKYIKNIIFSLFVISNMQCIYGTVDQMQEQFTFDVIMRGMDAGESIITIYQTRLENKEVYKLVSTTRTRPFLDFIYKIRDKIIIHVNKEDFSLLNVTKEIRQGHKKQNYSSIVDYIENKIFYKDFEIPISTRVHDPLTIIFYLRTQNLNQDSLFSIISYNKKKVKPLNIEIIGSEVLKTNFGDINCIIFEPDENSKKDNDEIMKIWISDTDERLPIKIEKINKNGKLILFLSSYVKN